MGLIGNVKPDRPGACTYLLLLGVAIAGASLARADIEVVREVLIAPKSGPAAANIGAVNASPSVVMKSAGVDVRVGAFPTSEGKPLHVSVRARFVVENDSDHTLALTVGFPVSTSQYPPFDLEGFAVMTDDEPRSVFNRVTGYPRHVEHRFVSGPDREAFRSLPDVDTASDAGTARNLFGDELIGGGTYHNLMVWRETFDPGQSRAIEVVYAIAVPLQESRLTKQKVRGSYKGIWPQEANNVSQDFLGTLPSEQRFYFFDYVLVTGRSWKGPIEEETVTLTLDESWRGHILHRTTTPPEGSWEETEGGIEWVFTLHDAEPTANLLFALSRN